MPVGNQLTRPLWALSYPTADSCDMCCRALFHHTASSASQ